MPFGCLGGLLVAGRSQLGPSTTSIRWPCRPVGWRNRSCGRPPTDRQRTGKSRRRPEFTGVIGQWRCPQRHSILYVGANWPSEFGTVKSPRPHANAGGPANSDTRDNPDPQCAPYRNAVTDSYSYLRSDSDPDAESHSDSNSTANPIAYSNARPDSDANASDDRLAGLQSRLRDRHGEQGVQQHRRELIGALLQ